MENIQETVEEALPDDIDPARREEMLKKIKDILNNPLKYKSIRKAKEAQTKHNETFISTKRKRKIAKKSRARNK